MDIRLFKDRHSSPHTGLLQVTTMTPRELPDLIADICLLSNPSMGSPAELAKGEWQTVLEVDGEYWSATLHFEGEHPSGEHFDAEVWLLYLNTALPMFGEGASFTVWEGETRATGTVKQITQRQNAALDPKDVSLAGAMSPASGSTLASMPATYVERRQRHA